jgi:peptidoglycan hydrolase-like protein with peptidoglycan-binding domain
LLTLIGEERAEKTIESLQRWLKAKGFDPGPIDGLNGPKTFAAWAAYQTANVASNESPPAETAPRVETEQRPVSFAPLGDAAPIKGQFSFTSSQMRSLCTDTFASYGLYADAIVEESAKYEINPLFVLADLVNQGVKPEYRNPWGISTDYYPYGPGGTQLGQPNGHVRNGPRKFSADEWRVAFSRQFRMVASGRAYSNARTIAEWAKIDAPAGAENDVHGTNAQEGADVGRLYNRLVAMLA